MEYRYSEVVVEESFGHKKLPDGLAGPRILLSIHRILELQLRSQ